MYRQIVQKQYDQGRAITVCFTMLTLIRQLRLEPVLTKSSCLAVLIGTRSKGTTGCLEIERKDFSLRVRTKN